MAVYEHLLAAGAGSFVEILWFVSRCNDVPRVNERSGVVFGKLVDLALCGLLL